MEASKQMFIRCAHFFISWVPSSIVGGALIIAGLYMVTWGRREADQFVFSSQGSLGYSGRDASLTIRDPLLKVLNHRGPSNSRGPSLPILDLGRFSVNPKVAVL